MKETIKKIKTHVVLNQTAYITGVITFVVTAGITTVIMRSNIARGVMGESGARGAPTNTASFNFRNKQTINITTVLDREGRGRANHQIQQVIPQEESRRSAP